MTQKFDIGLNSKINEFCSKFGIVRKPDSEVEENNKKKIISGNDNDIFEDFGNYVK
jgi:hypothetical protein